MSTSKTKVVAYKSILKSVEAYYKAVNTKSKKTGRSKAYKSEIVEQFSQDISKFLTKKGELDKRLGADKIKEFNRLVSEFKTSGHATAEARQLNIKSEIKEKKARSLVKNSQTDSIDSSYEAFNLVENPAISYLLNKYYLSWYEILDLVNDDTISEEDIGDFKAVAENLKTTIESDIPSESLDELLEDDLYSYLRKMTEINSYEKFVEAYKEKYGSVGSKSDMMLLWKKFKTGEFILK